MNARGASGAVDGKGGHHGLRYWRRRIRILCSSDFFVDFWWVKKKHGFLFRPWFFWVLASFGEKIGKFFWEIAHGFHEESGPQKGWKITIGVSERSLGAPIVGAWPPYAEFPCVALYNDVSPHIKLQTNYCDSQKHLHRSMEMSWQSSSCKQCQCQEWILSCKS